MKDPSDGKGCHKARDTRQGKKEKPQTNNRFTDKDGIKYIKVFDGSQGVYVWEVTNF